MKTIQLIILALILMASTGLAADVEPRDVNPAGKGTAYEWTLATSQTVTGASDTAVNVQYCTGPKALILTTSGATVSITFTINDDGQVVSQIDGVGIASATAETLKYEFAGNSSRIYVTSTITSGTVASIKLRCN